MHSVNKYKLKCPFCKAGKAKDLFEQGNFRVVRCVDCSLGYLSPMPGKKFLEEFYSKKYFEKDRDSYGYKNYVSMEKQFEAEVKMKIKEIKKYKNKGLLLDVGAGMGFFAMHAKKSGFGVKVLDISKWAVDYMSKTFNLKGFVSDLSSDSLPKEKFQLLTAWDVIEHLASPNDTFKSLNKITKKGGYVFLSTPNLESWDSKIFGKRWYGFKKIPEHLIYFSPKSLKTIAKNNGFEVLTIQNWGFARSLEFIAEKVKIYNFFIGNFMTELISYLNLKDKILFFPMVDMFVVLKKISDEVS